MAHVDLEAARWPRGQVPFAVSPAIKDNDGWMAAVEFAIAHYNHKTPIRLVERLPAHPNWIQFQPALTNAYCESAIGMQGGMQPVGCRVQVVTPSRRAIIHEIGHALGLIHEHQRWDRFRHFSIDDAKALVGGRQNYERLSPPRFVAFGPYDCTSVMQYPLGSRTALVRTALGDCRPDAGGEQLSALDIAALEWLYLETATVDTDLSTDDRESTEGIAPDFSVLQTRSPAAALWWTVGASGSRPMPRTDVFARGLDRRVYQSWREDGHWQPWTSALGSDGTLRSGPTATSWAPDRLEVFAIGDDLRLYQTSWAGTAWTGWSRLLEDRAFFWPPAAISPKRGRVELYAVGTDFRMVHATWDGRGWTPWRTDLPDGSFLYGPSVTSWSPDRRDVFAVGLDLRLYHATWSRGSGWDGWHATFGDQTLTSAPSAVSRAANRLDVFARDADGELVHVGFDGNSWSQWRQLGEGEFASGPAAVSAGPNRMDVYAVGHDRRMHRVRFDKHGWSGWRDDMGAGEFK